MPRKETITARCLAHGLGPKRTTAVLTYVMLWAMFRAVNDGRDPENVAELAEEIKRDVATLYRWQGDFREVFAVEGWESPTALLDHFDVKRSEVVSARKVGGWKLMAS